jgi:hypothetical protein
MRIACASASADTRRSSRTADASFDWPPMSARASTAAASVIVSCAWLPESRIASRSCSEHASSSFSSFISSIDASDSSRKRFTTAWQSESLVSDSLYWFVGICAHCMQQLSEMFRSLSRLLRISANSGRWNASLLADAAFLAARSWSACACERFCVSTRTQQNSVSSVDTLISVMNTMMISIARALLHWRPFCVFTQAFDTQSLLTAQFSEPKHLRSLPAPAHPSCVERARFAGFGRLVCAKTVPV